MRVAFLGLGNMGYHMAGHLARSGHEVVVYNRTAVVAQRWAEEFGGDYREDIGAAVAGAEAVISCVGNDDDVWAVLGGEHGALAGMSAGSLLIDHTTCSAQMARQIGAAASNAGIAFVDAPVSGGQAGAQQGQLTIMVGGSEENYARAQQVFACYAKSSKLMGEVGAGQLAKMVNQICVAGLLQGLAEGLHFAEQAGLDANAVMEVVSQGAASSWQMQNRYASMLEREFDFGFAVKWMCKDLRYALAEAGNCGASLPVTALVNQFYVELEAMGGANWDTSSLIQRLGRK